MFKAPLTYKPKPPSLLEIVILKLWTFGIDYNSAALSNSNKKDTHVLHTLDSRFPFILDLPVFHRQNSFQNESCKNLHTDFICKLCKVHIQTKDLDVIFHSVLQLLITLKRHFDFQAILSTTGISTSLLPPLLRFLFQGEGSNRRNCGTFAYLSPFGVTFIWVADFFFFGLGHGSDIQQWMRETCL